VTARGLGASQARQLDERALLMRQQMYQATILTLPIASTISPSISATWVSQRRPANSMSKRWRASE
jgi:hypothetical protein